MRGREGEWNQYEFVGLTCISTTNKAAHYTTTVRAQNLQNLNFTPASGLINDIEDAHEIDKLLTSSAL